MSHEPQQLIFLNGELVPPAEAKVSVEDRGFNFGDGLYEVVRVAGGRPFRLAAHLDRLLDGCRALEIPPPGGRDGIAAALRLALEANRLVEGVLYLQLTRGVAPRRHAFADAMEPTLVIKARSGVGPAPEKLEQGVSVASSPDLRFGYCEIKTIGLLPNVLAHQKAQRQGCYDGIFLRDGLVTEGCTTSVFCVRGGTVFTHPLRNILPSITRAALIADLRTAGVEVVEEAVTLEELQAADEVLLTGTTTQVMPVVRVDAAQVSSGRPGEVARLGLSLYLRALEATRAGGNE